MPFVASPDCFSTHPRLLAGSKALDEFLKSSPDVARAEVIEWLYLSTLSRRPDDEEMTEAIRYVGQVPDPAKAYPDVLWMLVNRSEYVLVR